MKVRELIDELYKELNRGDEEIFVNCKDGIYDFDLGIDINGQCLIEINKFPIDVTK